MKYITIFCILAIVLLPETASAQLVTCDGPDCNWCSFVEMVNLVIQWLFGFLVIVSVLLLAVAGLRMVTSAGNQAAAGEAKKMFTNVIIGFIIVLAAWVLVDTILKSLAGDNLNVGKVWDPVDCGQIFEGKDRKATYEASEFYASGYDVIDTTGANFDVIGSDGEIVNNHPVSQSSCSPLSTLTDDDAKEMESGNKIIFTNPELRACAEAKVRATGGKITSAYRPSAYQAHLKEIHTKWCDQGLQSSRTDCPDVYADVYAEMSKHGLSCSRPVATNSNHSSGLAVDISGGAQNNDYCLTWYGSGDPVHYTFRAGCTCD